MNCLCLLKIYFRLVKGAFAQANSSIRRSVTNTDLASLQTVSPATQDEQPTTSTNTNRIIATRLRQTDKRILRKIHSANSIFPTQEKSIIFNRQ